MRPWLSIIVPTYNGARFLADALASVVAQADPEIEVVAVDDGSTDETRAILRRWSQWVPMKIIERRHSGNWLASTAEGMAAAVGRYICWLHQDDTWRPRRVAAIRAAVAKQSDAAFVVHPCWFGDGSGKRIGYWRCALPRARRLLRFREVAAPLLVQCSIASCGAVISAEAVRAIGPPDSTLVYHGDWDYWLRLAGLGRTLHVPTALATFRIHTASQTIALAGQAEGRLMEARTVLRRHLPRFAASGGDAKSIERIAEVSAEVNHALNSLLAGQTFDLPLLFRNIVALGPIAGAVLVRDSRLIERCLSRLQGGAGLRPAVRAGFRAIARTYIMGAATPFIGLGVPNAGDTGASSRSH